ncbi:uncharacterized protein DUF5016 [Arcticibacter pallidicorallinus]|uniref:Uncharacterized protein DUF5016 n=1 Tax=Arcticibacter pallidicorallinus TaxID=1259464 RepID=A0A2T0U8P9_9SPHI|nr:DUF5125 domain-containing protein [Arcticibacter pallidicorallinus]PRY54294.1 uncharacterized protein DUF5016 [Arcticibacter pallidicorallinus]
MKTYIGILLIALGMMLFNSCKKNEAVALGNPVITPKSEFTAAQFGDSLQFRVEVSDEEIPLSTLKAQLFYSDEMVSETVIRTKTNGEYTGKVFVPFYANIPDGTATLKLVLQNTSLTISEKELEISLTRPDFPFLTLVTASGEHRMDRVGLHEYAATRVFPFSVKGYIKAPKVGTSGNEMTFGWEDNAVAIGSTTEIPFSNSSSGTYSITFNTFSYQASPFIIAYAVNGTVMDRIDDNRFKVDLALSQAQEVTIDGIEDLSNWFVDPDYFSKDANGKLTFLPVGGKYRITANFTLKHFIVEAMNGSGLATLQPDGTGAIWIIGEGIGKPGIATNQVGWNTDNALCMAPIGNKKYQVTGVAGTTFKADNINFKFFHQKGWGGEYKHANISTKSDLIFIGDGANGRDSGNLGIVSGKALEVGATYVFTVDLSAGNDKAVLTVTKK